MPARRGSAQAQSRALAFTATVGGECRHGTLPGGCSRERTTTNRIACGATGAHTGLVSSTPAVRAALAWVRDDFMCLSNATGPLLNQPTHGTKWTNRELLFHLWFGQRVARVLMRIIGVLSRLPPARPSPGHDSSPPRHDPTSGSTTRPALQAAGLCLFG